MSSNAPTIIDLKYAFLRAQIIALSQPLQPSAEWQDSLSQEDNAIGLKAVDEALHKLNRQLRQHNKLSYGPQAQRHVAEQIDRLYWKAGERGVNAAGEEWAEQGVDYRKENIIDQLPSSWSEEAEIKAPDQAARYMELQGKLVELNEKRRALNERLRQYKVAKELLVPFEEVHTDVQENLVVKNGDMEKELERMRMLMLRVERGVMALEDKDGGDEMDIDFGEDENKKILALLGST